MTPPRNRSHGPVHAPAAPLDPLADLRVDTPAPLDYHGPVDVMLTEGGEAEVQGLPAVFDQAWHEGAITSVVTRWHADRTADRALHKGTVCNCRYLARLALLEAVGVAGEPIAEVGTDG